MDKLRVGVLGLGSIFHRVMKGFYKAENCELYAVAARDGERAAQEAAIYGAKRSFGSYDELLACPEVDLIYVATPNGLHREQVLACVAAGKNILCEKSFALDGIQAREMVAAARAKGVFLMEAMWTRFMPAIRTLKEMLDEGKYGPIRHIYGDFSYFAPYDPNRRVYGLPLGGGALLDVGIYPLSISDMLYGGEPVKIQSMSVKAPTGVDARTTVNMEYAGGGTAQFLCGIDAKGTSGLWIYTEKGTIHVPKFWKATCLELPGGEVMEFQPENEGHHHQFVHVAELIAQGKTESPIMPPDETIRLMDIMTDIRKANGIRYPSDL